jgi:hypothetical protein
MFKHFPAFALLMLFPALSASAATVTFDFGAGTYHDTDRDGLDDLYVEDGISVTGFIFGELVDHPRERGHLDNPSDGHFTHHLAFTMGGRFDLAGFDLFPLGFECLDAACPGYDNVVVAGFRRGLKVAEHIFSMGLAHSRYLGGALFADLDRLEISTPREPFDYSFGNSHFEIDDVVLNPAEGPAPVPAPPALPLVATGLAGLWLLRRRA